MALPELTKRMAESKLVAFCEKRVPKHVRDEVRLSFTIKGHKIELIEERPGWKDPSTWTQLRVAQIRFNPQTGGWGLFCRDRNDRLHNYPLAPTADFDAVLSEIDRDPTCIFWG